MSTCGTIPSAPHYRRLFFHYCLSGITWRAGMLQPFGFFGWYEHVYYTTIFFLSQSKSFLPHLTWLSLIIDGKYKIQELAFYLDLLVITRPQKPHQGGRFSPAFLWHVSSNLCHKCVLTKHSNTYYFSLQDLFTLLSM